MQPEFQHNLVVIEGRATYERIISALRDIEPEEAIGQIQNFLKIYPDFAQAHNDLAVYYYKVGNTLKALAHHEKAHKLAPKNITFLKNLADFYIVELGWTDDAIHIYLDILKDNPFDVEVLNTLGAISQHVGRKEQSRQYYNRVLQLDPGSREARQGLQLLGVAPPSQEADYIMPQIASVEPFRSAAMSQITTVPVQTPVKQDSIVSPEEQYRIAVENIREGNTGGAIQALEALIAVSPRHAPAHNDLGVLYQQNGSMDLALKHQEQAASIDPANTVYQKNLADLLFIGFGEHEKALAIYVDLLSKTPRDVEILKAIAHVCIELGQFDNARHFLEQILAVQPWDKEARAALNQIKEGGQEVAAQSATENLSPDVMYADAQTLVKEERFEEARALLEKIVQQHDSYALAHNDLGVFLYQAGDVDGALKCYQRASELDPSNVSFRKNLADLYFVALGKTDEAINIYLELLRESPRNVETLENLGHICKAIARNDEARTFYRRALEIEPWNAGVRTALQTL